MVTLRQVYNHMLKCDPAALDMELVGGDQFVNSFETAWYSEHDEEIYDEKQKQEAIEEFDPEWEDITSYDYAAQFKKVMCITDSY